MTSPRPDRPSDSNPVLWLVILAVALSLALLATSCRLVAAQDRTIAVTCPHANPRSC